MDAVDLIQLLSTGESERVEFKESFSGGTPTSLREAVCAFANNLPGLGAPGVAFIGVRDDGAHSGLQVSDELLRNLADIKTDGNILPPPSISIQSVAAPIGELVALIVTPSDSPPVRYKGRVHIRVGPRRAIATAQEERILNERRRALDAPFDVRRVPNAGIADLDLAFFENGYLAQVVARDVLEANDRTVPEQLAATKMIAAVDDPVATVLGLLVLGKNPQDFLPGTYVQFTKFAGGKPSDPVEDSEDLRGTVADVIRRLDEKLGSHNRVAVDVNSKSTERRTELYPIAALRQVTRNALLHRTYDVTHAPVHVRWFADRIEVLSPGGPFGVVTAENFATPGLVDYRNPNLAEALRALGYVQRFGIGIQIARNLLVEAGHTELKFTVNQNTVLAEIPANPELIR